MIKASPSAAAKKNVVKKNVVKKKSATDTASDLKEINPIVFLTAIFIVIVLVLHHGSYTHDYIWRLRAFSVDSYLQKFAVGGFLFLSGYKLAASKLSDSAQTFLTNRFIRIYPPYLLALIVYSFTDYLYYSDRLPSLKNFLLHALLLQSFFPGWFGEVYRTTWFVSVLLCCYLLFLATRNLIYRPKVYVFVMISFGAMVNIVRELCAQRSVDVFLPTFEVFVAFFSVGMLYFAHRQSVEAMIRGGPNFYKSLLAVTLALLTFAKIYLIGLDSISAVYLYCFDFLAILISTIPIYLLFLSGIVRVRVRNNLLYGAFSSIAMASFFVFLFHRPVWAVMANIWADSGFVHSLYLVAVGLPIIFALSYWGQVAYAKTIKALF